MSQRGLSISTFIPESIGGQDVLFDDAPLIGTIEFFDGVIVFGPAILFLMIGDLFLPRALEPYTMTISIVIAAIGSIFLVVKPNYMTVKEWVQTWKDFRSREKDLQKNLTSEDGGPIESIDAVPDDDTRQLTKVEKVYPNRDIIELEDGTMIAVLEFTGSNLDMASQENVLSVVEQYSRAVSSQLQHDIQFYLPMRPISMESTIETYQEQKKNVGTEQTIENQFMDAYLDDRVNWVASLGESSFIREQYVIVPVSRAEVYRQKMAGQQSGLEKLPGGDILEDIRIGLTGDAAMESKQEMRRKQLRELENRAENIGGILSKGPGNSFRMVQSKKSIALLKEFWEGERMLADEMDALSSEYPFSVGPGDISNQGDNE